MFNIFFGDGLSEKDEIIPLFTNDDDELIPEKDLPEALPILPLKNTVLFPGVILPIAVGREKSLRLIKDVYQNKQLFGTISQKDSSQDNPAMNDLHKTGTLASIIKLLEMPDGSTTAIIQGKKRFEIKEEVKTDPYLFATYQIIEDVKLSKTDEFDAIISAVKDASLKIINLSTNLPTEASFAVKNIESPTFLVNFIASNAEMPLEEKQKLIEVNNIQDRAILLLKHLNKEIQLLEIKKDIQSKVKKEIDQQQREFLLHQQIKTIQNELGGSPLEQETKVLKEKALHKKWNKETEAVFNKELEKFSRLNPASGEFSVQLNYLQTLLDIPWNEFTIDKLDLKNAQKILDKDHFGMEKIKERIIEHLAVLKLKKDLKSPILCFYGAPGVGKTSLGKSIAEAIGRKYVRVSLGGVHDEAEIRGHRKTYIGAMPGRIIQNLKKAKSANPVFILDEIDKLGTSMHGDPSSALLEVLDPEQNNAFYDNYLELDFDLSKVLFIATANTTNTIHPALLDRMELINVTGYIIEEKIEITKKHLWTKQAENHGLAKYKISLSDEQIEFLIENYTRESGVRELDKTLAKIARNIAKRIALNEKKEFNTSVNFIQEILGVPRYINDRYEGNEHIGVVTGLAWTAHGGEILYIETSLSKGKGNLTLTGNLGDVMKESASLALAYLKAHAEELNISSDIFENNNIHIHVPEGAIPKDGPSAGVTMATSLASAICKRKVKENIAMTGEITLRGKVLPVGGIKEKILAAKRANITDIILSKENLKDINEIQEIYLKGLTFHYVSNVQEVLQKALL